MEKNEVLKIHCSLTKNLIYLTVSTLPNCLHNSEITAESEYCQIMRDNSIYVEIELYIPAAKKGIFDER